MTGLQANAHSVTQFLVTVNPAHKPILSVMTVISQIKAALPIAPFLAPYTGGLKSSGHHFFLGRCPFHQKPDDPPSKRKFWVDSQHNICGCFVPRCPAYCNRHDDPQSKPLDIINFWSLFRDIPPQQAIAELAREAGV